MKKNDDAPKWSERHRTWRRIGRRHVIGKPVTYLLMAEDPLDVSNRLPASDDETVSYRQRDRASNPLALSDVGASQQIVSFRHDPEYAVLLWQQRQLRRGTDAVKYICTSRSILADAQQ